MLNVSVDVGQVLNVFIDDKDTGRFGLEAVQQIREFAEKQQLPLEDIYIFAGQKRFIFERELNHRRTWLSFYGQYRVDECVFQYQVWQQLTEELSKLLKL